MNLAEYFGLLCIVFFTKDVSNGEHQQQPNVADGFKMYKSLFKYKRVEQLDAVKTIIGIQEFEKKYRMIKLMIQKIGEVTSKNKATLEKSGYIPGGDFPEDSNVREALAQTVENTALFGDILLRMPDITHEILNKEKEWSLVMKWSVGWSNSTGVYDKKTTELMNLVAQELNIVERDPNYKNPYKVEAQRVSPKEEKGKAPEKKPKKKTPKGPRLSGVRNAEL